MDNSLIVLLGGGVLGLGALLTFAALFFRRVVSTNEVHIVQSAKKTTSYGKDTGNGNTYYQWPSWLPVVGITKIVLPVSVFDLDLAGYEAYDKGRLPFVVDVKAFFRISDSNVAAQRVSSFSELHTQLQAIVQGAVRTILASSEIEEIMQGRSTFGEAFTKEVNGQLVEWGVTTVKNIELMDIRDSNGSRVIHNIMEKKKSHIEMESRQEVAKNTKMAQVAEIEAAREVELQKQNASQSVGLKTIEAKREVDLAAQAASQLIKEKEKLTKEKELAVLEVQHVRTAEIQKGVQVVAAQQAKETSVIQALGQKESMIIQADGKLEAQRKDALAIEAQGSAKAAAEKALLLAPVEAQITLAKEIGGNEGYQKYLVTIKQVEARQAVGMEQARALEKADVKIIANTGNATSGMESVMDIFTSNGGTQVGAFLEGLSNTDTGKAALSKLGLKDVSSGKK